MPSALGYGLMGAAQGFLQGVHNNWAAGQEEARTQRLLEARRREAISLQQIEQEYADYKDKRDHAQARELKGMDIEAAGKRQQSTIDAADRRARESREASDTRAKESAAARIRAAEISASRPRGSASQAKQQLFVNDAGDQKWIAPGEDIPAGYYRAPASGKPKSSPTKPAGNTPGTSRANPIDAQSMAERPPSGTWVRLPSGVVMQVP